MSTKIANHGQFEIFFCEATRSRADHFRTLYEGQELWALTLADLKKKLDKMTSVKIGRIPVYFDEYGYDEATYEKGTVTSVCDSEGHNVILKYEGGGHSKRSSKGVYPITPANTKKIERIHAIRKEIVQLEKEKKKIEESLETVFNIIQKKIGGDA